MRVLVVLLGIMGLIALLSVRIYYSVEFSLNCEQYIKRAAVANTIELAKENLDVVIKYLEKNELTNGIVSVFLHQPENDVGFWYSNLKASVDELSKVKENTTQLEKSNLLIKLRETLLDDGSVSGVTLPSGITIYPYNVLYAGGFFLCFFMVIFGFVWCACSRSY
jgi:hypothetical protein